MSDRETERDRQTNRQREMGMGKWAGGEGVGDGDLQMIFVMRFEIYKITTDWPWKNNIIVFASNPEQNTVHRIAWLRFPSAPF